jgi:hypothetical protein
MWAIYPFWNGWSQTLLGNVPTIGLVILSFVGLVRLRAYLRELAIFWTLPIFVTVAALISWGSWRFRQPGDLGLIVLAAAVPWIKEVTAFVLRARQFAGRQLLLRTAMHARSVGVPHSHASRFPSGPLWRQTPTTRLQSHSIAFKRQRFSFE